MEKLYVTPNDSLSEVLKNLDPNTEIILSEGVYREKLEVKTPNITFTGQGADKTKIVFGDYAKKLDEKGVEYNTFRTYTVAVLADNVRMNNLTIENDSRSPEVNGQEVALTVYADEFSAENCAFVSTQDTIFCGPLPPDLIERYVGFLKDELRRDCFCKQIFKSCLVEGNVDFIFGCGDALFEDCEIKSVYDVRGHGYVAAPAHALSQNTGFVFHRCRFTKEDTVADKSIYLARPWRDYGKSSFIECEYGSHISPEGFDKWNDTERDKTARFYEYAADRTGRVPWSRELSEADKNTLLDCFR